MKRYVIFAANVRSDKDLYPASRLVEFVDKAAIDLAVVDISDFFAVFCAELNRDELLSAFNRTYQMLADPNLSGREEFMAAYREVTNEWQEVLR
ncbi:MAG: hypothetical protein FJ319_08615 [SAR202 cluster bacterium]|nr:hypothetical protein [SAR202 cluster bacterium]